MTNFIAAFFAAFGAIPEVAALKPLFEYIATLSPDARAVLLAAMTAIIFFIVGWYSCKLWDSYKEHGWYEVGGRDEN